MNAPWNIPGDGVQDKLATWLAGMDAATEADTEYDGLLSYASEAHASIIGLAAGLALGLTGVSIILVNSLGLKHWQQISNRSALKELEQEPWYAVGASMIGHVIQLFGLLNWILDAVPF